MHITHHLLTIFLNIYVINAAIIAWSNKKVEISPLLPFDDEDLEKLVKTLGVERVYLFKVSLKDGNAAIPKNLKEVMNGFHSSYNPNGNIATSNAVELFLSEDCNGIDTNKIQKTTGKLSNSTDFLCVLDVTYPRKKRAVGKSPENDRTKSLTTPKEAVIYIGQNKKDNQYALLYSSKPLKLEINNTTKYLGNTDNSLITVDKRFNIPIPLEEKGKVTLRFGISWISGYWYLQTVKVEMIDESNDNFNYDLTTDENIMASADFSYHCNGRSVFSDEKSGTKLIIYDLQVQLDAKKKRFGDVNDCVPFTTAPIWSGLFVFTILGVGLIVALTAIMDIKTMDKFDNHKTKNLSITVME
ncbi:uncharacterized protein LOC115888588 [Sitophilus oryzae]|uniref:Uncharacterized protein LOC115888588 n=1 Tax=Sitophilus oryzae TaxID=7048 RepID=A0A6J2YM19_SITOR|nr:uncharacterized protein LOC115888588 [Sitophilus oryzae]